MSDSAPTPESLSATEAETLAARVAQTSGMGLSLAAGLRAAAAETDSRRLARTLRKIAASIDQGHSLSQATADHARGLPPHIANLMQAAEGSGRLGVVLPEWIENQRAARAHWRNVTAALSYPLLTVALALVILFFFSQMVVPQFQLLYSEFGLKLPVFTQAFLWFSDVGVKFIAAMMVALCVVALAIRIFGGRSGWSLAVTFLPVVGNLWHWSGVAEMLRVLSLLIEERLELGPSLRLTGQGVTDAYVGHVCQRLAQDVENGLPLWRAILDSRALPLSIVPLVRWGEKGGIAAEALRAAAEMLEGRLRGATQVLVTVLPPLVFVLVAAMVVSVLGSLVLPMIALIQGLT